MVHITDVYNLKAKLNSLKNKLYNEQKSQKQKEIADRYLNEIIFLVDKMLR
jgi:hypothetical protein